MEGTATTAENKLVDASTFTWKLKDFLGLSKEKMYSDIFVIGGYKWRLLIFPRGKNVNYLSLYLDAADSKSLPYEGNRSIGFSLAVINQVNESQSVRKATSHNFDAEASDWGFREFMPFSQLYSTPGFLVKDTCVVEVKFETLKTNSEVTEEKKSEESKLDKNDESGKQEVKRDEREDGEQREEDRMGRREKSPCEEINDKEEENDGSSCGEDIKEEAIIKKNSKTKEDEDDEDEADERNKEETEKEVMCGIRAESDKPEGPIEFEPPSEAKMVPTSDSGPTMPQTLASLTSSVEQASFAGMQTDLIVQSKSALEDFAALFEEIAIAVSKTTVCPDEEETSKSLSMLNQVSKLSFSEIPSNLRADLTSAFQVLVQATTLPSAQASAIHNFFKQFKDLCQSYDSSVAAFNTAQQFFNLKDGNVESLKRIYELQLKIKSAIKGIRKEKEQLGKRLRELDESESQLLEDYTGVGTEALGVKAEWDGLNAKTADMVELREKAENEKAGAETVWNNFISLFKRV